MGITDVLASRQVKRTKKAHSFLNFLNGSFYEAKK